MILDELNRQDLGFVMAIDGCSRGCEHCPAYKLGLKPVITPMAALRDRLGRIRKAMPDVDFATEFRTVHSWRISDLLDYFSEEDGVVYNVVSVAEAWHDILGQPLYVVTNGTMGHRPRVEALRELAEHPELVSQVKLTVTPFDPKYRGKNYAKNMAADVATLWPLGELPSRRYESDESQRRVRINVKAAAEQHDEVVVMLREILGLAGLDASLIDRLVANEDPRLQIKPVYDLRQTDEQPLPAGALSLGASPIDRLKPEMVRERVQLGFRPNGDAFAVDLHAFNEHDLFDDAGKPRTFDNWFE